MLNLELKDSQCLSNLIVRRKRFRGGVLLYILEDISCKQLTKDNLPVDIVGRFVKIKLRKVNLRKVRRLLFRTYPLLDNKQKIF